VFIKRLNQNHYDVFIGNGWDNWTRVRRHHWGVAVVDGKKLSREAIKHLNERFMKK
jgi:hypothetical protein